MDETSQILSKNITELRDALGLSQKDFALLANISASTLANIESGKRSFRIKSLDGITNFTTIKLEDLSKRSFVPPKNLRETLNKLYNQRPVVHVLLNKEPSIPYCIKYRLLLTDFLNTPRETNEIRSFFLDKGWKFKGNSLHTALKRMPHLIKITPHPNKDGTNLYVKL